MPQVSLFNHSVDEKSGGMDSSSWIDISVVLIALSAVLWVVKIIIREFIICSAAVQKFYKNIRNVQYGVKYYCPLFYIIFWTFSSNPELYVRISVRCAVLMASILHTVGSICK